MKNMADSVFGREVGLMSELIVTGRKVGAGRGFYAALAHNVELFKQVVDLVNIGPSYDVVVDYRRSLNEMIKAAHCKTNQYCKEKLVKCKIKGKGKVERSILLYRSDEYKNPDEIIAELKKQGYRPATIAELLALIEYHPELLKGNMIFALGSRITITWKDNLMLTTIHRFVPCAFTDNNEPTLEAQRLSYATSGQNYKCFAAVRI
ncbi:hypothetical protein MYX06_04950 [Patescibacteria group bacterium AH-259-L05]|nr:hypothetical protein [Patescibacteria group bacterium AH-259-L05]